MTRFLSLTATLVLSAFLSTQALAHSDTKTTVPANGAILDEMPEAVSIHMTGKIRLMKVEMQFEDHKIVEIDISEYRDFQTEFTLPVESMGAGMYRISWRALGLDGHPIVDAFQFSVME